MTTPTATVARGGGPSSRSTSATATSKLAAYDEAQPLLDDLLASRLDDLRRLTVLQVAGLHALSTGSLDVAAAFLADATQIADQYQSAQETGYQNRLLAELARRQLRLDEASELIDQALKLQLASDNVTYTRESIVEKIRTVKACVGLGRDGIDRMIAEAVELVSTFEGEGAANMAFRSLMDLELASIGEPIDPDAAGETIELLESCGFGYEAALVRLLTIDALLASGADRARLEAEVVDLAEIATTRGTAWIADRVASLVRAARLKVDLRQEPPPTDQALDTIGYPHDLTDREVEVLSLLAEGLTNKTIGQRLYVSPRTVSTHVSNLLAKLGVTNRGEAAAIYHRLGIETLSARRNQNPSRTT